MAGNVKGNMDRQGNRAAFTMRAAAGHTKPRSSSSSKGRFFSMMGLKIPSTENSHRICPPAKASLARERNGPAQPSPSIRRRASSLGLGITDRPAIPTRTSSKLQTIDKKDRNVLEPLVEHVEDVTSGRNAVRSGSDGHPVVSTRTLTLPGTTGDPSSKNSPRTDVTKTKRVEASDGAEHKVEGQPSPMTQKSDLLSTRPAIRKTKSLTKPKAESSVEAQASMEVAEEPLLIPKTQNKAPSTASRAQTPTSEHLARLGPLANFIPVSTPNPLHPPLRPPSPLPPPTTITLSKSPKNATKVKFGDTTIHTVAVHPGWHLKPIGPKRFKTRSGLSYIYAPADPLAAKKKRVIVEFPVIGLGKGMVGAVKLRRHKERQAAMARYWLRTEKEEQAEREEMRRRAEGSVRRYTEEEGPSSGIDSIEGVPGQEKGLENSGVDGEQSEGNRRRLKADDGGIGPATSGVPRLKTYLDELTAFLIVVLDREPIMAGASGE